MAQDRYISAREAREKLARIRYTQDQLNKNKAAKEEAILVPNGCPNCHRDIYLLILGDEYMWGACATELLDCPFYDKMSTLEAEAILMRLEEIA